MLRLLLAGVCAMSTVAAQQYTANFSTTSYNCGASIGCPIQSYPLYDSLYYSNIADSFQTESGSGNCYEICAHSPEFYGAITNGNTGAISANYDNSKVARFSFKSFWAGCTAPVNITSGSQTYQAQTPAACDITIQGYTSSSGKLPPAGAKPIATQKFTYTPSVSNNPQGLPRAEMAQFVASPGFGAVRIVTFTATVDRSKYVGPPNIYIDDLVYNVQNSPK